MNDQTRHRLQVDAPEIGASVWLVEGSVMDVLPLMQLGEKGDTSELLIAALGASLEVDGRRVTPEEIRRFPARTMKRLLTLGLDALRINGIVPASGEAEEKKD